MQTTWTEKQKVVVAGMVMSSLEFVVPLDHSNPLRDSLTLFVRKVVAVGKEDANLPYLLYLQGGPGFPSPRPEGKYGWLKRATDDYQVLLLDQRGCGLSHQITYQTLATIDCPNQQAEYLSFFRADSIVKDCEIIRVTLLGENGQWSVLGQSFGGFCLVHYMSVAPFALKEAMFAGGLPSIIRCNPDDVYRLTYKKCLEYNQWYYARYPEDIFRVKEIVYHLSTNVIDLPSGGVLTPRRFQGLGIGLGLGSFEKLHYLIENAWLPLPQKNKLQVCVPRDNNGNSNNNNINNCNCNYNNSDPQSSVPQRVLSYSFLRGVEAMLDFEANPIYAVLHEAIYCQGEMSNWSAERIYMSEFPQFNIQNALATDTPFLFVGEMVFSWMLDDYRYLQPFKQAAQILAQRKDWPVLYDLSVLAENTVPCAAIIYYDDMYVPREFSEETASLIKGMKTWVTNLFNHSGLNSGGEIILSRLLQMVRGDDFNGNQQVNPYYQLQQQQHH